MQACPLSYRPREYTGPCFRRLSVSDIRPDGFMSARAKAKPKIPKLWLPEDVRHAAMNVLRMGHRIPEEVLGPDEMMGVWERSLH